jgi:cell division protease FtsH
MSEKLGLRTFEKERRSLFIETSAVASPRDYSEEKAKEIDEEVEHILEEAHKRVHEILSEKRQVLEDLYRLLMEKEVVEGEELRKILGKTSPQPEEKQIPDTVPA